MWICEKCNEEIEDNFDSCWNCADAKMIEKVDGSKLEFLYLLSKKRILSYFLIFLWSFGTILIYVWYRTDVLYPYPEIIPEMKTSHGLVLAFIIMGGGKVIYQWGKK